MNKSKISENHVIYFISIWFVQATVFLVILSTYYLLPSSITGITNIVEAERREFLPLVTFLRDDLSQHPDEPYEESANRLTKRFIVPLSIFSDDLPVREDVRKQLDLYSLAYDTETAMLYAYAPDRRIIRVGSMGYQSIRETGLFNVFLFIVFSSLISTIFIMRLKARQRHDLITVTDTVKALGDGKFDARIPNLKSHSLSIMSRTINIMASRLEVIFLKGKDTLNGMAHEFRTPLARMNFLITLLETADDKAKREYLDKLKKNVDHMSRLSNAVLAYSKASHMNIEANYKKITLESWFLNLVDILYCNPEFKITVDHKFNIPAIYIDDQFMGLALQNLLNNSAKYGATKVIVTIDIENDHVVISISDDGNGIPDDKKEEIFLPFVRLNGNEGIPGFGIGLSFVQSVVEMHGGNIIAKDNEFNGITFLITLPLTTKT